ncbi:cryptochrome/photolyase family protein [Paraglaciecola sp. L3A3]|uniref:cryptochrome/photolyase family protein n=1 Tax=Paraglaciecola sp. L3A3 TaxID=2686358 RepID=UPI00131EA716|nr:cryptochrome/photolyase family protein [Paraglaciecola sp. L3A3]
MHHKQNTLRLILGDQLNASHSWFKEVDENCTYVIAELHQETSYVTHHVQKIQAFFAAMTAFADALKSAGHRVLHLTLDETKKYTDLPELLTDLLKNDVQLFEYQQPDEYRLSQQLTKFCQQLAGINILFACVESEHFYLPHKELPEHFKAETSHRMEFFYRYMRKRFKLLVDQNNNPDGGKWNFDQQNRNKLKKKDMSLIPAPLVFSHDVSQINERIERHKINTMGDGDSQLLWPINRQQSLQLLDFFCRYLLPSFGTFQDAMTGNADDAITQKQWSLYHSRLSFSLNSKMISPKLVVDTVIKHYQADDAINLAQVEGFIRQIVGWREFIRGMYWINMPQYHAKNALQANNDLPSWFWNGDTKMNCLHHAIKQSLQYSYAHHIQRLMITGNFCLLTGIDPVQVDRWYLGIYVDAIEWVELPNTRGMSQFADGGLIASKAYAASGNYVNKMSDYCQSCHYDVKQKTTDNACPLNSLYWHFMEKHSLLFESNPRQAMVYKNWRKQPIEQQQATLDKANYYLQNLEKI